VEFTMNWHVVLRVERVNQCHVIIVVAVTRKVDAIGETVSEILKSAEESGRRSHEVADAMAEAILAAARQQSTHRKP